MPKADKLLKELNDNLKQSKLNKGQLEAAKAILSSPHRVHGIQGYAGTGKTYMLGKVQEVLDIVNKEELKKNPNHIPYELKGLAPSGAAVKELQKKGIKSQTLQGFIKPYRAYASGGGTKEGAEVEKLKFTNKIFVTDEASMVEAKQMQDFMVIADQLDLRIPLMGDIRQLSSVGAGRPAYEMQRQGMPLVKMNNIIRQQNKVGKAIAYSAYARDFGGIFEKVGTNLVDCSTLKEIEHIKQQIFYNEIPVNIDLTDPKAIKELGIGGYDFKENPITNSDTALAAAKLYFSFDKQKRDSTLMVAQTNATKDMVNEFVREVLLAKKELGDMPTDKMTLVNANPTLAQKELFHTYEKGSKMVGFEEVKEEYNRVILFNKANRTLNIKKNEYFEVQKINKNHLLLRSLSDPKKTIKFNPKISKSYRKHIELYKQEKREFRANDKVMFTRKIESPKESSNEEVTKSSKITKETDIVNSTLGVIKEVKEDSCIIRIGDKDLEFKNDSPALKHIDHSYCRTTHKAQGATEHTSILITESWWKHLTEERNLLVQVTRHSDDIYMIVDNKGAVIETILKNQKNQNDSSLKFLVDNKESLVRKIELSQSLFKAMGGDEEYTKYKIAAQEARGFDHQKEENEKTRGRILAEKIDSSLTQSENIKNKLTALDLISGQKDKHVLKLQRNVYKKQQEELRLTKTTNQPKAFKTEPRQTRKSLKYTAQRTKKPKFIVPDFENGLIQQKFKEEIINRMSHENADFTKLVLCQSEIFGYISKLNST